MLLAIRERLTGWIAYVIVILISIPFALWGMQQYFGGGEDTVAASVNGEEISMRAFDREYARQRQAILNNFGGNMPAGLLERMDLKGQVLEQMIEKTLLAQVAREQGLRVSDAELAQVIRSFEAFSQDGQFDSEVYQAQLRSQGMTSADFENRMRRALVIQQLQAGVRQTGFAVPRTIDYIQRLVDQQREVAYIRLAKENAAGEVEISEADARAYFEDNADAFRAPERVKLAYLELSAEKLAETVPVSEDTVERLYAEYQERIRQQEVREASHILLKLPEDAGEAEVEAARERARELRARIQAGEAFAKVAREVSDDPGSAQRGGRLGVVERGQMVEAFEKALYALEPGEISEPVRTRFGLHLIRAEDVRAKEPEPLAEVREKLVAEYRLKEAENMFFDQAEQLATITYEQPDSLLPAAEAMGLEIQHSDWVSRESGEGIAADARVRKAAFSDEVLEQRLNSEMLELGANRVVVIRVEEHEPAAPREFEEVREQATRQLREQRIRERLVQTAETVTERWASGAVPEKLAGEVGGQYVAPVTLERGAGDRPPALVNAAFAMGRSTEGESAFTSVRLGNGDRAVLRLVSVADGDPARMSEADREQLAQRLASQNGGDEYAAVLRALKAAADIERSADLD